MSNLKYVIGASSEVVLAAAKRDMRERNRRYERNFSPQGTETFLGIKEPRKRENIEYIDSDTFKPTGKELGYGCWGIVDEYIDAGEQKWAIKIFSPNETAKRQMEERKWTEEDVMRKEAIPLYAAHSHVVPRIIERDRKGKMYIAMPVYEEGDLSSRLHSLSLDENIKVIKDVVDALAYLHEHRGVHSDVKPSNIFISDGRAFLSDLGSTTCISIDGNGSKRGPHGDENYRAPECFDADASPSTRADVWGLGSIFYEMLTKKRVYDDFNQTAQKELSKKIKKVPRPFRSFLGKCLSLNPIRRYKNSLEMKKGLEKAVKKYKKTFLHSRLRRYGSIAAAATILAGATASLVSTQRATGVLVDKVEQLNENAEFKKKRETINLYLQRRGKEDLDLTFSHPYDIYPEDGKLEAALFKFKDKKVGLAAYIDPNDVFEAMMNAKLNENATNFSYEAIESFLRENNSKAYWQIWQMNHTFHDRIVRLMRADKYKEFEDDWNNAKKVYEVKKERERIEAEKKEKQEQKIIENQKKLKETLNIIKR